MGILLACLTLTFSPEVIRTGEPVSRLFVCVEVGRTAERLGVEVPLAIALSWEESRFDRNARSSKGAIGPLQVIPRFVCPGGVAARCDLVGSGIALLGLLTDRFPALAAVAHYNAGRAPPPKSFQWAKIVLSTRDRLRRFFKIATS